MSFRIPGEGIHAYWHLQAEVDLRETIEERTKQKAVLARYGRQDMFEERSIPDLERAMVAIGEVVKKENEASAAAEDR